MSAVSVESNRPARLAVLTVFFINGALFANWISRIPDVQSRLNLSEGELGLVLTGIAVGVLSALTMAGGLIARYGSRIVTIIAALLFAAVPPLLGLAPHPVLLWLALFFFGAFTSTMDVAMNAQAVEVERRHGKPLMSSFHAFFSVGGFFGALMGSALTELTPLTHFMLASVIAIIILLLAVRPLVHVDGEKQSGGSVFRLPERALWMLGAIAFAGAIGEGAMADWSAVYLTNVVGTGTSTAALGFAAFSLTMTAGRFMGDWLTGHFSASLLTKVGGAVAAGGLMLAVLIPNTLFTLIGFAAVGAGCSYVIPLAFSAAGKMKGAAAGSGIAGVATIGYAGFLAGPPIIGLIAEVTSLRVALSLVALLIATLLYTGKAMHIEQASDGKSDANL